MVQSSRTSTTIHFKAIQVSQVSGQEFTISIVAEKNGKEINIQLNANASEENLTVKKIQPSEQQAKHQNLFKNQLHIIRESVTQIDTDSLLQEVDEQLLEELNEHFINYITDIGISISDALESETRKLISEAWESSIDKIEKNDNITNTEKEIQKILTKAYNQNNHRMEKKDYFRACGHKLIENFNPPIATTPTR